MDINIKKEAFNTNILVYGAGAGGSTITYLLAQYGFKNLVVIDDDLVESTDVERAMIFQKKDLKKYKTHAIKDLILENFGFEIKTLNKKIYEETEIEETINSFKAKLVIKACDPAPIFRKHLNKVCFLKKIPFIYMAYSFENIRVGPFFVPDKTACDECLSMQIKESFSEDNYDFSTHYRLFSNELAHPSVSFNINILSNIILKEIICFLGGKLEYVNSFGTLVNFCPLNFSGYTMPIEKACSSCLKN